MQVREAKDFLVQQATEQAALEQIPLSELEKRMMYFTEGPDATEDPITLNDEFEAQYDTAEYETKMSTLLHHAYERIKKENPETKRRWSAAIQALEKGDHYLSVLWSVSAPMERGSGLTAILKRSDVLIVIVALVLAGLMGFAHHFGFLTSKGSGPSGTHWTQPEWFGRLLLLLGIGAYLGYWIVPLGIKFFARSHSTNDPRKYRSVNHPSSTLAKL